MTRVVWVLLGVIGSTPAFAHHMADRQLPATLLSGLLSGLGHPIIGWDHLAFVIGAGLLAATWERGAMPVVAFVLGTLGGCLIHVAKIDVPGVEPAVAGSLLAVALLLVLGIRPELRLVAIGLGIAGLLHGYAYGESIVGAEPTPLLAYLVGFTAIQLAIGLGVRAAARALMTGAGEVIATRAAGTAIAVVGMLALAG